MSQEKKGLKKEKVNSIENEVANSKISAKTIVSQGNILKQSFDYDFDDSIELHSGDKINSSLIKHEYE